MARKDTDESLVSEEKIKRNDVIKLYETVYEILGKAWPLYKETQGKLLMHKNY